jgi:hypothetical protein
MVRIRSLSIGAGLDQTDLRVRSESDVRWLAQRLAALVGRRLDDAVPFVGWEVVSVFKDEGRSGYSGEFRPGFEDPQQRRRPGADRATP